MSEENESCLGRVFEANFWRFLVRKIRGRGEQVIKMRSRDFNVYQIIGTSAFINFLPFHFVVLTVMEPFQAKLVAAATGSTLTALTSELQTLAYKGIPKFY